MKKLLSKKVIIIAACVVAALATSFGAYKLVSKKKLPAKKADKKDSK